jgi:hypothetical protein
MVLNVLLFLSYIDLRVFFGQSFHANGTNIYARVIPFKDLG